MLARFRIVDRLFQDSSYFQCCRGAQLPQAMRENAAALAEPAIARLVKDLSKEYRAAAKELALDGPWAPGEEEAGPLPEVPQGPAVGTLAHTLELLHQRRAVAQDPAGLAVAEG